MTLRHSSCETPSVPSSPNIPSIYQQVVGKRIKIQGFIVGDYMTDKELVHEVGWVEEGGRQCAMCAGVSSGDSVFVCLPHAVVGCLLKSSLLATAASLRLRT